MDTAKALDLRAANDPLSVWELEYDGPSLTPGRPVVAVPTTAGTGAETNSFGVITDEAVGRKGYIGHPSLLPVATILDPALTVGLPPAATAATGIDAMTHSLESLLSANPNPFAESTAIGVIRTVVAVAADGPSPTARTSRRARRCCWRRTSRAWARRAARASGSCTRWATPSGRAAGSRTGRRSPSILPEVLDFYRGTRDRELAMVGVALGVASPTEDDATAAGAAIGAIRRLCAQVGQRPTLRALGFDERSLDVVAQDAIDDAAIRNSPRLPTLEPRHARSWGPSRGRRIAALSKCDRPRPCLRLDREPADVDESRQTR